MYRDEQLRQIKILLARLDSGTTVDAGGFRHNPTTVYVDPVLAEREWATFFRSHPQIVGMSGDLPEAGSFLTMSDFGTPVLMTRDRAGRFRAFVNACRHRGAQLETAGCGTRTRFACPFHAWTYDNDGTLIGVPKKDHFGDIDQGDFGLIELPAEERHGILWVHPQVGGRIDVDELLTEELSGELASWQLADLAPHATDTYEVDCNWKLAMDTFGETYHFTKLHRNTINLSFHGNVQAYDDFGRNHRMLLVSRAIDQMRERPESEWDITTATLPAYWLFPNVQLLPFAQGCYLVRAYPIAGEPGRHISRISIYLRPGVPSADQTVDSGAYGDPIAMAQAFADIIRDEDYVMSASQQVSATAGALPYVVFGRNEPALHHYHQTYRSVLGMPPLPLVPDSDARRPEVSPASAVV